MITKKHLPLLLPLVLLLVLISVIVIMNPNNDSIADSSTTSGSSSHQRRTRRQPQQQQQQRVVSYTPYDENHGPYEIIIDGETINGDGTECFESTSEENGVLGFVSGKEVDSILVWDEDAPCGEDGSHSYIHYASNGTVVAFQPMTAGAGRLVHTYRAAILEKLPVPVGSIGCYPVTTKNSGYDSSNFEWEKSWRVARYGTSCPTSQSTTSVISFFVIGLLIILFAVIWKHRRGSIMKFCDSDTTKTVSYIALSTVPPTSIS